MAFLLLEHIIIVLALTPFSSALRSYALNEDSSVELNATYQLLQSTCPMQLQVTFHYYYPFNGYSINVTRYEKPIPVESLQCDTSCKGGRDAVNTSHGTPAWPIQGASTVIGSVHALQRFYDSIQQRGTSLPWCEFEQDGVGYWVPTRLLSKLWDVVHRKQPQEVKALSTEQKQIRMLLEFMSGNVAEALHWPNVWIPSQCRARRYDARLFLRCAKEWKRHTNTTLWLYFVGDSTTRGTFCGLLRHFVVGGEYAGQIRGIPCFQGTPFGILTYPYSPMGEHTYNCTCQDFLISYQNEMTAGNPNLYTALYQVLGPNAKHKPSFIIFNSGAWEHMARFHTRQKKDTLNRKCTRVNGRRLCVPGRFSSYVVYKFVWPTADNPINHTLASEQRKADIQHLLRVLSLHAFRGQFIYRTNYCNSIFEAKGADREVEAIVRKFSGKILHAYNFSVCRQNDFIRDNLHIDRCFKVRPSKLRPSVGELNIQIIQSLLNGVCNRYVI